MDQVKEQKLRAEKVPQWAFISSKETDLQKVSEGDHENVEVERQDCYVHEIKVYACPAYVVSGM